MRTELLYIALTSICWGGYPLVARSAGHGGPRGTVILMLAGMVPITAAALLAGGDGWPQRDGLLKLLVAGLMMGGGLLAFHALATSPMQASVSIPIVDVAMLLVSALGAILFFAEPFGTQKALGVALLVAGIALLRPA